MFRDQPEILATLIDAGVDIGQNTMPRGQITNPKIVNLIASQGGDVDIDRAENGWPPIVYLSRGDRGGDVARIQELIEQGENLNVQNHKGQTALHCAAKAGFVDIISLLLEQGVKADVPDQNGESALATALKSTIRDKNRLHEVIKLLIQYGANANHADHQKRTPFILATRKKDKFNWSTLLNNRSA